MTGEIPKQGQVTKEQAKPQISDDAIPADDGMLALSRARHTADERKIIARLRKQGMRHRAKASGYLVKAKRIDEKAATLMHKANQLKQESLAILDQAKNKGKAATEFQKKLDVSGSNSQGSDAEMQMSRLEHEEARLTRQSNQLQARAAAMTERASRMKRRSVDFMQKQRSHEIESAQYLKRAEEMDKRRG